MSDVGDILIEIAEADLPDIAVDVMPDVMNILGETRTQGPGGGQIKAASPIVYEYIPVLYEPRDPDRKAVNAEQMVSSNEYRLMFPVYGGGDKGDLFRIDIDPKNHRLQVMARGNEPEKIFRITSVRDLYGVYWEANCEKEN